MWTLRYSCTPPDPQDELEKAIAELAAVAHANEYSSEIQPVIDLANAKASPSRPVPSRPVLPAQLRTRRACGGSGSSELHG